MANLWKKFVELLDMPPANPMQQVRSDPTPTLAEMEAIANHYKWERNQYFEQARATGVANRALRDQRDEARAELERLKSGRARSNANLMRGSKPKTAAGDVQEAA